MALKKLEEHNAEAATVWLERVRPVLRLNGIACPATGCAAELLDSEEAPVVDTYPPRLHIHCNRCGWRGTRVA